MPADYPIISVIIPNYNGEHYVEQCLRSLLDQSFKSAEVLVVDNNSTDRSIEIVHTVFPSARLIRLQKNMGFAAAVNKGIESAKGKYIALVNNDTIAEKEFLAELFRALADEPAAGMAAPLMLFLRDSRIVNSAGLGYSVTGSNHDLGFGEPLGPEFEKRQWVFGPSGGAGMFRRELFECIGGFDEDFFMYYEDVDLCLRAQLAGYGCIYVPSARIQHAEGGSSRTLTRPKNYFFARNSLWTILKGFPSSFLIKYFPLFGWEMLKRALSPLREGDCSALAGYCAALISLRRCLQKRRQVQRLVKYPLDHLEELLNRNRSVLKRINIRGRPGEEGS